ncbi:MAG: SRPBCC family protein [Chloroflexota bacterium]
MGDMEVIVEPGRQDIVIKRSFDAPRDVVFKAMTDPALVPNWWGPRKYETIVDVMEPQAGGRWRFRNRDGEGNEFAFNGVFHEVTAPERIIQTFEFEPLPGHVSLDTMTLEERDGRTYATAVSVFQSIEDRDGMVQSGMEGGARETYDRLDEVIQELAKRS